MIGQALVEAFQQHAGLADVLAAHVAAALAGTRLGQGLPRLRHRNPHGLPRMDQVDDGMGPHRLCMFAIGQYINRTPCMFA